MALGAVAGVAMLVRKAHVDASMDADGVHDRAYRLQNSVSTFKTDLDHKFLVGGVAGAVVTAAAPNALLDETGPDASDEPRLTLVDKLVRGFSVGATVGFALGGGVKVLIKFANKTLVMQ